MFSTSKSKGQLYRATGEKPEFFTFDVGVPVLISPEDTPSPESEWRGSGIHLRNRPMPDGGRFLIMEIGAELVSFENVDGRSPAHIDGMWAYKSGAVLGENPHEGQEAVDWATGWQQACKGYNQ